MSAVGWSSTQECWCHRQGAGASQAAYVFVGANTGRLTSFLNTFVITHITPSMCALNLAKLLCPPRWAKPIVPDAYVVQGSPVYQLGAASESPFHPQSFRASMNDDRSYSAYELPKSENP